MVLFEVIRAEVHKIFAACFQLETEAVASDGEYQQQISSGTDEHIKQETKDMSVRKTFSNKCRA